jgi:hypothetical protein
MARRVEAGGSGDAEPVGAQALVGAWHDVADADIDAFVADISAERARDGGRPLRSPRDSGRTRRAGLA